MSFLDRFQGKIATVTAQGHLRKADGSEEIRVGPPKRKPQPVKSKPISSNNNSSTRTPEVDNARPAKIGNESARSGRGNNNDRREESGFSYGQTTMPGQLSDDNSYNHEPRASKSPSPTLARDKSSPRSIGPHSSQQSPKERNETRVKTEQDQLAFSRKARPVSYEPCKLSQYKKEKPGGYYELGKLQPDLNSDDLVQKRANVERIKAFSKNLRDINKTTTKKPEENNEGASPKKEKSTRDKALEFAKRVPKPKVRAATPEEDAVPVPQVAPEPKLKPVVKPALRAGISSKVARPINSVVADDSDDDELSSELLQLQQRHQLSRAQVDALIGSG